MNRLVYTVIFLALLGVSAWSVDYDGEKSELIETPYSVCIVPPQVDEAKQNGIVIVNVAQAKGLYDNNAHIYDARDKRHYLQKRIKGAEPVYFDVSKAQYIVINLPRDRKEPLLFYCYGESCANSYEAALAVRRLGYQNVYWFLNGFNEWETHKFPTAP